MKNKHFVQQEKKNFHRISNIRNIYTDTSYICIGDVSEFSVRHIAVDYVTVPFLFCFVWLNSTVSCHFTKKLLRKHDKVVKQGKSQSFSRQSLQFFKFYNINLSIMSILIWTTQYIDVDIYSLVYQKKLDAFNGWMQTIFGIVLLLIYI